MPGEEQVQIEGHDVKPLKDHPGDFERLESEPRLDGPLQYAGEDELPPHPDEESEDKNEHSVKAPELGEVVVDNEASQIPVHSGNPVETVPGWNAPEDAPLHVDPKSPKVVHDKAKALEMAKWEGVYGRSESSSVRAAKRDASALRSGLKELQEGLAAEYGTSHIDPFITHGAERYGPHLPADQQEEIYQKYMAGRNELYAQHPMAREGNRFERDFKDYTEYGDTEDFERSLRRLDTLAREADDNAKRYGELAGVLHDHPVSDAYKEAHPALFAYDTAYDIIQLEDRFMPHIESLAEDQETLVEKAESGPDLSLGGIAECLYLSDQRLKDLEHTFKKEGLENSSITEIRSKIEAVGDSTTIGEAREIASEAQKAVLGYYQEQAENLKSILEDVKAGRADQTPEPSETKEAA